jgi:hypothetical protein
MKHIRNQMKKRISAAEIVQNHEKINLKSKEEEECERERGRRGEREERGRDGTV